MSCLKKIFFLHCLFFCCQAAAAQQKQFTYINLTKNEGLPSNEVYQVFRDSKNYMWFATDNGVVRYSGTKMETFNLPDNVVFKIREDNKGRIWFFTHTGKLSYYDKGTIIAYQFNDSIQKFEKSFTIINAHIDRNNDEIWINCSTDIYRFFPSGKLESQSTLPKSSSDTAKIEIFESSDGILLSQYKNYYGYNHSKRLDLVIKHKGIITQKYTLRLDLNDNSRHGACRSKKGINFFFIGKFLFRLNPDGSLKQLDFPNKIVFMKMIDEQLVVGVSKKGYFIINENLDIVYFDRKMETLTITDAEKDIEGGVWFSSIEKGVFQRKSEEIYAYAGNNSLSMPVFRMLNIKDKYLVYGNAKGLYKLGSEFPIATVNSGKINSLSHKDKQLVLAGYFPGTGVYEKVYVKDFDPVSELHFVNSSTEALPFNDSWLMNPGGWLVLFNTRNGYSDQHLTSFNDSTAKKWPSHWLKNTFLYKDSSSNIWGGSIYSLSKIDLENRSFTDYSKIFPFFKKGTTCMRQIGVNVLAVGLRFSGIVLLKEEKLLATIKEKDGLISNKVNYLLSYENQLWAATSKGISIISFSSYDPVKYNIKNLGKDFDFHNQLITQLETYQGKIFVATNDGMMVIENPTKLADLPSLPLKLYIDHVDSNNKNANAEENKIILSPDSSKITISLSAICFNAPDEVKYYYRFKQLTDTSWVMAKGPEMLFEKLAPGNYQLELKAMLPLQQRESDIREINITVQEYWWQNNLLKVLGLVTLFSIVYLIYKWRVKKIKKAATEKINLNKKITELEHIALRSQMNPHFTFNCLSSIQQLIVSGQNELANEYLIKFSRLLRRTLEMSASSITSISNEIDYLGEYIVLEQLRMPGQFSFEIINEIPAWDSNLTIPVMMIQPLVENSIRHGIKPLTGKKGKLDIHFSKTGNMLLCTITDNGIGRPAIKKSIDAVEHKSYGIEIINKRLISLSKEKNSESPIGITVQDLDEKNGGSSGTKVTLQIPIQHD